MSGAAVAGLVTAIVLLIVLGGSALAWRRDSEWLRVVRANRWAKEADLALPPELAEPLAARVRRQTLINFFLVGLLGAPVLGLTTWLGFRSGQQGDALLPGPLIMLVSMAVSTTAGALGQLWTQRREMRTPGERVRRPQPAALKTAVPWWVLWAARALVVVSPLAAVMLLFVVRGKGVAIGYSIYVLLAVLVVVVLLQMVAERWQTSTLNGPRQAGSIAALAFDDAFRVRAVIGIVPLAPTLSCIASSLVLQTLYSHTATAQRPLLIDPFPMWWMGLMTAVFLFNLVAGLPWVRRYYRRGWTPQPPPPLPES